MKESIHRPTHIEVDLKAISTNIHRVMDRLPSSTKVYSVVKANAYGHGVERIAPFLQDKVDGFCVSNLDEALELRELGIEKDILVLGVVPVSYLSLALEQGIVVTAVSLDWIEQLEEVTGLRLHLKVDTGMGRIGFRTSQELNQALHLLKEKGVLVEGIFTHFATADQEDDSLYQEQLQVFKATLSSIDTVPEMVHASNSATSIWHKDGVFNMVRLGDIQFGLNPSGLDISLPFAVQPALSLYSELIQVKRLEKGRNIGYGATYQTETDQWIGTVPIGYADGLTRDMQGFHVLVDGQVCPIVGRVSMDQITICLPQELEVGTKVTLIGSEQDKAITVQDWATYRQTINYEVVCLLSDRIPRYYH